MHPYPITKRKQLYPQGHLGVWRGRVWGAIPCSSNIVQSAITQFCIGDYPVSHLNSPTQLCISDYPMSPLIPQHNFALVTTPRVTLIPQHNFALVTTPRVTLGASCVHSVDHHSPHQGTSGPGGHYEGACVYLVVDHHHSPRRGTNGPQGEPRSVKHYWKLLNLNT